MEKVIVHTDISVSEWGRFKNFLYDNGIYECEINVNPYNYNLEIHFNDRYDAVIYKLKCIEDIFFCFGPYYFEPDTEFECDLEKLYGYYSECDETLYRKADIN